MFANELELLAIQSEGSIAGWYGVKIASSPAGQALWIGADVPDALATELAATFDPDQEPAVSLAHCQQLLDDGRALTSAAGPSYLIDAVPPSPLHVERSDAPLLPALRDANPGNWHPVEWNELLDGTLGPWAIALDHGLVVSICHTPVPLTARGAECGVWTAPPFRGRGYAAAVVAEWAAILKPSGRHLFYSTRADNYSSQRVAQRLQLRLLGWTWRVGAETDDDTNAVHPLCSLRT